VFLAKTRLVEKYWWNRLVKTFSAIQSRQTRGSCAIFQLVDRDTTIDTAGDRYRTSLAGQIMIDFLSPAMKR
jgi:hypothetical protein